MKDHLGAFILAFAALLDYGIGDPWGWLHPVQVIGWVIDFLAQSLLKNCQQKWQRRYAGIALGLTVILGSGVIAWCAVQILQSLHPLFASISAVILLASCLAGKSLRQAAQQVLIPLKTGDLPTARKQLSQFVGRDTENLSEEAILRATLESVAENTIDGVTSPLFYAILGLFFFPISGVAFAITYKAASTLDSMIGYLREPYTDIGWFSAKFEDYLTWLPCRLTVLTLALLSGKPRQVLRICRRDAPQDPSLNSGWSEAVYAAILGVQLGGMNTYQGVPKWKPLLGDPWVPLTPEIVEKAFGLTRSCFLLWLAIAFLGLGLKNFG
ncbi:MAG: adenosylcobinamide-phosphate synthase CbiB [Snowella sp.]|nr:adenosylcobinamide-phosphate synthase CbiB [Snowella sp.]